MGSTSTSWKQGETLPEFPSGKKFALSGMHIMEPDKNWFKAPEGHFWYWVPEDDSSPPFYGKFVQQPAHAPVPTDTSEMLKFIRVFIQNNENEEWYWSGDYAHEFPFVIELSDEDREFYDSFLATDEKLQVFLEEQVIRCATQAEINKDAFGYAVVQSVEEQGDQLRGQKIIDNPLKKSH